MTMSPIILLQYCFLLFVVPQPACCVSVFQWIFGSAEYSTADGTTGKSESLGVEVSVPFEMTVADEKFLSNAAELSDSVLSQLDMCHHKIIIGLKKSCMHLNEEEISKLSVNLLNCQSYLEDRPVYPCSTTMALKDCTRNMDKDTWNAYHIISNRARAVCYSTRQVQFRAKTEMTINKLVTTAEEQLLAMSALQGEQEKLGRITDDTLKTITTGHNNLLQQQHMLKNSQQNIHQFATSNLRELMREKALIASGQKELAMMTEVIKQKLDAAESQLTSHEDGRRKNHFEVVNDLAKMKAKARIVWERIDNGMQKILKQHEDTALHYRESLHNLRRVNDSINYLLHLIEQTRSDIDDKINWFVSIAKETGVQMTVVMTVVLHLVYFLFCAVAAAFVNAPSLTRISLLILVPLNAFCEVNTTQSLGFRDLSFAIVSLAILQFAIKQAHHTFRAKSKPSIRSLPPSDHCTQLESSRGARYERMSSAFFSDGSNEESSFTERDNAKSPADVISSMLTSLPNIGDSYLLHDYLTTASSITKDEAVEPYINKNSKYYVSSSDEMDFGSHSPLGKRNGRVLRSRRTVSQNENF